MSAGPAASTLAALGRKLALCVHVATQRSEALAALGRKLATGVHVATQRSEAFEAGGPR